MMTNQVNTKKWVVIVLAILSVVAALGCSDDDNNPCADGKCITADTGITPDQKVVRKDGEGDTTTVKPDQVILPECPPKDTAYKCIPDDGKTDKADVQDWVSLGEKNPTGDGSCNMQRKSDQAKRWFDYNQQTKIATDPIAKLTCNPAQ